MQKKSSLPKFGYPTIFVVLLPGVQLSMGDFERLEKSSGYITDDGHVSDVSHNQKV